ncbi:MAG: hypothetical protein IT320_20395 [Anaerolineae bacterium]|nr:hypothetical protein [Anaerolineae bacterium]
MTDHPVLVNLPDAIFDPLRQIAEEKGQSVEAILIEQLRSVQSVVLPALSADEERELIAFKFLSEDTLRAIAKEQMPDAMQAQLQQLMDKNNLGTITPAEHGELTELVERSQRLMLRKAWAAGILMERGHSITGADFADDHE